MVVWWRYSAWGCVSQSYAKGNSGVAVIQEDCGLWGRGLCLPAAQKPTPSSADAGTRLTVSLPFRNSHGWVSPAIPCCSLLSSASLGTWEQSYAEVLNFNHSRERSPLRQCWAPSVPGVLDVVSNMTSSPWLWWACPPTLSHEERKRELSRRKVPCSADCRPVNCCMKGKSCLNSLLWWIL